MTILGAVRAEGTGVCHDKDGNLLDNLGNIVVGEEQEKDEVNG